MTSVCAAACRRKAHHDARFSLCAQLAMRRTPAQRHIATDGSREPKAVFCCNMLHERPANELNFGSITSRGQGKRTDRRAKLWTTTPTKHAAHEDTQDNDFPTVRESAQSRPVVERILHVSMLFCIHWGGRINQGSEPTKSALQPGGRSSEENRLRSDLVGSSLPKPSFSSVPFPSRRAFSEHHSPFVGVLRYTPWPLMANLCPKPHCENIVQSSRLSHTPTKNIHAKASPCKSAVNTHHTPILKLRITAIQGSTGFLWKFPGTAAQHQKCCARERRHRTPTSSHAGIALWTVSSRCRLLYYMPGRTASSVGSVAGNRFTQRSTIPSCM